MTCVYVCMYVYGMLYGDPGRVHDLLVSVFIDKHLLAPYG